MTFSYRLYKLNTQITRPRSRDVGEEFVVLSKTGRSVHIFKDRGLRVFNTIGTAITTPITGTTPSTSTS